MGGLNAIPLFGRDADSNVHAGGGRIADMFSRHLARITLLHPGPSHDEWRCWLDSALALKDVDADEGLVLDALELTLTAAAQGHGVAIGDARMARDRIEAGVLVTPLRSRRAQRPRLYFLVYPSQRAPQHKIRALAESLRDDGGRRTIDTVFVY